MSIFDSQGFIIVCGMAVGLLALIFKSRCTNTRLCFGLIDITRDTHAEMEEAELQIQNQNQRQNQIINTV